MAYLPPGQIPVTGALETESLTVKVVVLRDGAVVQCNMKVIYIIAHVTVDLGRPQALGAGQHGTAQLQQRLQRSRCCRSRYARVNECVGLRCAVKSLGFACDGRTLIKSLCAGRQN